MWPHTSMLRKLGFYCWSWEPSNGLFSTCVTFCSLFYAVANIQYEISKHSTTNPLVLKTKSEENCHKLESLMKVTVVWRGENECDKKDWMKKWEVWRLGMKKFEKVWQEKMDRLSDRQFRGTALVIVVIGRWWCGIKCVWYCFGL